MSDNRLFWRTVKPFFFSKGRQRGTVKLVEGIKLPQDDSKVAEELNNFFEKAVSFLYTNDTSYIMNPESMNMSNDIEK